MNAKVMFCIIVFLVQFSTGCDMKQRLDTKAIVSEMKKRQVKRVTSSMLVAHIEDIAAVIKKDLLQQLNNARLDLNQISKIAQQSGTEIYINKPVFLKTIIKDKKIIDILDAYQYNIEKNIPSFANIQKNEDQSLYYYTEPITKDFFLNTCSKEAISKFEQTFDLATVSEKDTIKKTGLLVIVFHKNEVIKRMDSKLIK